MTTTTTPSNGAAITTETKEKALHRTQPPAGIPLVDTVTPETPRPCAIRDGSGFIVYP